MCSNVCVMCVMHKMASMTHDRYIYCMSQWFAHSELCLMNAALDDEHFVIKWLLWYWRQGNDAIIIIVNVRWHKWICVLQTFWDRTIESNGNDGFDDGGGVDDDDDYIDDDVAFMTFCRRFSTQQWLLLVVIKWRVTLFSLLFILIHL